MLFNALLNKMTVVNQGRVTLHCYSLNLYHRDRIFIKDNLKYIHLGQEVRRLSLYQHKKSVS